MTIDLRIGNRLEPPGPALLDGSAFDRHTFLCGQSGSGKTYALGVLLEQLLAQTTLHVVVFDPNGDYRLIREPRGDLSTDEADHHRDRTASVAVLSAGGDGPPAVRWRDLTRRAQAAVLRLDPIRDREEFNAMINLPGEYRSLDGAQLIERLKQDQRDEARRLAMRIENLEILAWSVWARGDASAVDQLDGHPRGLVLDVGGFEAPDERGVLSVAVLDELWRRREERRPTLVVIDEAHQLCPAAPESDLERLVTERLVQIAGEGRKYGLWLLLASQRPAKIHANVLSQCDNLILLKMVSPADVEDLARVFGYAPVERLRATLGFPKGRAIVAGGIVDELQEVEFGGRRSLEPGGDVAIPPA